MKNLNIDDYLLCFKGGIGGVDTSAVVPNSGRLKKHLETEHKQFSKPAKTWSYILGGKNRNFEKMECEIHGTCFISLIGDVLTWS